MRLKVEITYLDVKDMSEVKVHLHAIDPQIPPNKFEQLEKYGNSFVKMTDPTKRMFVTLTQELDE